MSVDEKENEMVDGCEVFCQRDALTNHVINNMPPAELLGRLADLFKVLGDPTRVKLLWALSLHEMCVCELSAALDMSQSMVSHQLRLLKNARLVACRREGRSMYYSLADAHVSLLFSQGLEHVQEKEGV